MSEAYAALVAPNGTVTPLDASAAAVINGVDVSGKAGCSICEAMTPKSIGPYLSVAYTQLAASYALETRFVQKNCSCSQTSDTPEMPETKTKTKAQSNCKNCNNETASIPAKQNSIWFAPFGNYNHVREQGKIPRYNNQIGGALVGYDHQGSNYLAGASLGYAFNYIGYKKGIGHGKINNEMASIYGSYNREHFRLNGALWGPRSAQSRSHRRRRHMAGLYRLSFRLHLHGRSIRKNVMLPSRLSNLIGSMNGSIVLQRLEKLALT
jgi:outer membrane autotransporter protein